MATHRTSCAKVPPFDIIYFAVNDIKRQMWARYIYTNSIASLSDRRLLGERQTYDIGGCIGNFIVPMQRLSDVNKHTLAQHVNEMCNTYGFRPTNVTDVLLIHIKAAHSRHLNSVSSTVPANRTSHDMRVVKYLVATLFHDIPTETDILCILARVIEWIETLDPSCSRPCLFIGCEQGLNRTGFVTVQLLVRLYGITVDAALSRFRNVRPPGIIKTHFISTLYRRFNAKTSIAKQLPPTFYSKKQLQRITGRQPVESRKVHNAVPQEFEMFMEHAAFEAANRNKPNQHIVSFMHKRLRAVIERMHIVADNQHTDKYFGLFYTGFSRPLPCDQSAGKHISENKEDWCVSIKADGIHVTLLCTPIATFVLERGKQSGAPTTLPYLWRSPDGLFLNTTVLEGERLGNTIWIYDILDSPDLGIRPTTDFRMRYNMLVRLHSHNQFKRVKLKPFLPLLKCKDTAALHFDGMPEMDGLIIYNRNSKVRDACYKIKLHHTVELQVTGNTCYGKMSDKTLAQIPHDLCPGYTIITNIEASDGLWECMPSVQETFIMFSPFKRRTDAAEPNLITPTISSCIALTVAPFYPHHLFSCNTS